MNDSTTLNPRIHFGAEKLKKQKRRFKEWDNGKETAEEKRGKWRCGKQRIGSGSGPRAEPGAEASPACEEGSWASVPARRLPGFSGLPGRFSLHPTEGWVSSVLRPAGCAHGERGCGKWSSGSAPRLGNLLKAQKAERWVPSEQPQSPETCIQKNKWRCPKGTLS